MNSVELAVYETVRAELAVGETPLSSVAWELQETHGLSDNTKIRESAVTVVAGLLEEPDIGIYELRDQFVPWSESGAQALRRLVDVRTRVDADSTIRAFGWDDEPQLFLLRHSVRVAYDAQNPPKATWRFWQRGT